MTTGVSLRSLLAASVSEEEYDWPPSHFGTSEHVNTNGLSLRIGTFEHVNTNGLTPTWDTSEHINTNGLTTHVGAAEEVVSP